MVRNSLKYIVGVTFTHPNKSCDDNVFLDITESSFYSGCIPEEGCRIDQPKCKSNKKGNNKNEFNIMNE